MGKKAIRKSIVSGTVWNTAGTTIVLACQWLITVIVVWLYDDFTNAGNLSLAMSITNVAYSIAMYNMRAYQVSDVRGEFSDSVYIAARFATCLGATILCAAFVLLSDYTPEQRYIILFYMLFRAAEAMTDVLHGIVQKQNRLDYAGKSLIFKGLLLLASFSLFGWLFDLLPAIIAITVVTALIGLLYDLPRARKLAVFPPLELRRVWELLSLCFPLMLVMLMLALYVSYPRYTLELISGTEALGAYSSAVTPALAVQVVVTFSLAPLMSLFSECVKKSDRAKLNRVFAIVIACVAAITLLAYAVAHFFGAWGLELLLGPDIRPHAYLLTGAVAATGLTALLWIVNIVFSTIRDVKGLFVGTLVGVAVCVASAGTFIEHFGPSGTNYVMIVCQAAALLALAVRYFWRMRCQLPA